MENNSRNITSLFFNKTMLAVYGAMIVLIIGLVFTLKDSKHFSVKQAVAPKQVDPAFAQVPSSKTWEACKLSTLIGKPKPPCLLEADKVSGMLSFGPYVGLPAGQYTFELHYSADQAPQEVLGGWDVQSGIAGGTKMLAKGVILGTSAGSKAIQGGFGVDAASAGERVEIRTEANGKGRIVIESLVISRVDAVAAASASAAAATSASMPAAPVMVGVTSDGKEFSTAPSSKTWGACKLPTLIGKVKDGCLLDSETAAGVLSFGPYASLPVGNYSFEIKYKSPQATTQVLGTWDVHIGLAAGGAKVLSEGNINGSTGATNTIQGKFAMTAPYVNEKVEIRTQTNGKGGISLESVVITRID